MSIEGLQLILCPVDFSELSGLALRYADALAKCSGGKLSVVYANPFLPPPFFDMAQVAELELQFRQWHASAVSSLRTFVNNTLGARAAEVDCSVVEASPVDGILDGAAKTGADLVVVGTHGRSGVNRLMMGSVAERILRESSLPVLTVRGDSLAPGEELRVRRLLCAVDDSGGARRALAWAVRMARCFGATVAVLHVREKDAEHAISDLDAWIPKAVRGQCEITSSVREGQAAEAIVAAAREARPDILIIGAHHRPFHDASVIGPTTVLVVRHSPCPVLSVTGRPKPVE